MSRIAKVPVELPGGVEFSQSGNVVTMKGGNGTLTMELNSEVELKQEDNTLTVRPRSGSRFSTAIAGTTRALLANMAKQGQNRQSSHATMTATSAACIWTCPQYALSPGMKPRRGHLSQTMSMKPMSTRF